MKRMSSKAKLRIKIFNLKLRRKVLGVKKDTHNKHVTLPECVHLGNPACRDGVLASLDKMQKSHKLKETCYLDFYKVNLLLPDGTIHLLHHMHKFPNLELKGRASRDPVVKSMLSKLGVHKRLQLANFEHKHSLVDRWYYLSGEDATLGEEFDIISEALSNTFQDPEHVFIIETAISEAITNVVHHAYEKDAKYKSWLLFVGIESDSCSIVISDLGQTIPKTAPKNLLLKFKDQLAPNWFKGKNDAERIAHATTLHTSSTLDENRGFGFADIIGVKAIRENTEVFVHSRRGAWSSKTGKQTSYTLPVSGTIVYWKIPLGN